MPPCSTTSASGHRPTIPLIPERPFPKPVASPLSAAPIPPPLVKNPPSRYLGQSTCLNFSQTARKSRDNVSHTDSSMVFCGARRSSPGIDEVRYDPDIGGLEGVEDMLPVKGVRSEEVLRRGSSASIAAVHQLYK